MKNSLDMTQPVIAPQATARGGLCSDPRLTLPVETLRAETDLLLSSPVFSGAVKSFGTPLRAPPGAQPVPRGLSQLVPPSASRGTTPIQVRL